MGRGLIRVPLQGIGLGLVKPNPPGQYHTAPEPTMIDLRWAAAVAGYPSQPLEYLTGRVEAGTYPEGLSSNSNHGFNPVMIWDWFVFERAPEDFVVGNPCAQLYRFPNHSTRVYFW